MKYYILFFAISLVFILIIIFQKYKVYKSKFIDKQIILNNFLLRLDKISAITDNKGVLQIFTPTFNKLFGNDPERNIILENITEIISIKSKFNWGSIFSYLEEEKKPIKNIELTIRANDLDYNMSLSVFPVFQSIDEVLGYIYIFDKGENGNDILHNLDHIEKLTNVGKIAAGMAHELNTPLGSIMLSADHIRQSVKKDSIIMEASKIKSRAEHCSSVVKELLSYVRKTEEIKSVNNIEEIIMKVQKMITSEISKKRITINVTSSVNEALITCNENQIEQLFFNLFSNSCYAIEEKGEINIKIYDDPIMNQIVVKFSDNGSGINIEHINKVFEPFYTTKPGSEGTGLGLALCNKIMVEHSGSIVVDSKEGAGATFNLRFPKVV